MSYESTISSRPPNLSEHFLLAVQDATAPFAPDEGKPYAVSTIGVNRVAGKVQVHVQGTSQEALELYKEEYPNAEICDSCVPTANLEDWEPLFSAGRVLPSQALPIDHYYKFMWRSYLEEKQRAHLQQITNAT